MTVSDVHFNVNGPLVHTRDLTKRKNIQMIIGKRELLSRKLFVKNCPFIWKIIFWVETLKIHKNQIIKNLFSYPQARCSKKVRVNNFVKNHFIWKINELLKISELRTRQMVVLEKIFEDNLSVWSRGG